jgi:hypothetical protein
MKVYHVELYYVSPWYFVIYGDLSLNHVGGFMFMNNL